MINLGRKMDFDGPMAMGMEIKKIDDGSHDSKKELDYPKVFIDGGEELGSAFEDFEIGQKVMLIGEVCGKSIRETTYENEKKTHASIDVKIYKMGKKEDKEKGKSQEYKRSSTMARKEDEDAIDSGLDEATQAAEVAEDYEEDES